MTSLVAGPWITSNVPAVSGGGGGGTITPTVGPWGPDFGEGSGSDGVTTRVGINVTNPANALIANQNVGVNVVNNANVITFSSATVGKVGVHVGGSILGAPFWQSVQTATATATPVTVNIPSGTVSGDLLLAFIGGTATTAPPTFTTPTGWTVGVATVSVTGAANGTACVCYYRIATGTEGASQAFAFGGSGTVPRITGEIHRIIGVDTTTPIDASATDTLLGTALTPDPVSPTLTTTVVNTMVFAHLQHDHLALTQSHTPPASHQETDDFEATNTSNIDGATTDYRLFAAIGATGTATHDCTETVATDATMIRVAIRPGSYTFA